MLTMSEKIKIIVKRKGITMGELAERLGISRQNLSNKLSRDNFSEKELLEIAEKLNCEFICQFKLLDTDDII